MAALRCISHEHVVRILDAGRDDGRSFIVMELLRGVTLGTRLKDGARLSLDEARLVVAQAALALAAIHGARVVHRDIKPSNLFLAETERGACLKVLDFGIARSEVVDCDASASARVGSPPYMSPEQARGHLVDGRTDLWALAVVAFKMLTGAEPFSARDVPSTLQRVCEARARPLRELRPDLPEGLTPFFKRAFSVDLEQRFREAGELSEAFARACKGGTSFSVGRTEQTAPLEPVELAVLPALVVPSTTARESHWHWPFALVVGVVVGATTGSRDSAEPPTHTAAVRAQEQDEPGRTGARATEPGHEARHEVVVSATPPSVLPAGSAFHRSTSPDPRGRETQP